MSSAINLSFKIFVAKKFFLFPIPMKEMLFLCRAGTIDNLSNDFKKLNLEYSVFQSITPFNPT